MLQRGCDCQEVETGRGKQGSLSCKSKKVLDRVTHKPLQVSFNCQSQTSDPTE